jgi:TonB family protein
VAAVGPDAGRGSGDGPSTGQGNGSGTSVGNGVGDGDRGEEGNGGRPPFFIRVQYPHTGFTEMLTNELHLDSKDFPHTWEDLCKRYDLNLATLYGQPRVSAIAMGNDMWPNPDAPYLSMHEGGMTLVRVTVSFKGRVSAAIEQSSGDDAVDRTAVATVERATWLPTLDHANPIDDSFIATVTINHTPLNQAEGVVFKPGT